MNPGSRSSSLAALAAALLGAGCVHFPPAMTLVVAEPEVPEIVFHDVEVFTATSAVAVAHQDVRVRGGLIEGLGDTRPAGAYPNAQLIEGAGKTLLPGLIDIHAHPTGSGAPFYRIEVPDPERNLQAHLYVGVTTVADPGGDPQALAALRDRIASWEILGPRLFFAGRIIAAEHGYPGSMLDQLMPWPLAGMAARSFSVAVASPEEARAAALANLQAGATFLKVAVTQLPTPQVPRLSQDEIAAVVEEAHRHGVKVVAHIDAADDALLCAKAGVDGLWHDVQLDTLSPDQVAEIAGHVHVVVPTLTTFDGFDGLYEGKVDPSPLVRATESPGLVQSLVDAPKHLGDIPPDLLQWMKRLHANHSGRRANVRALHDAGVTILVGTDGNGADGSFPANYPAELLALHDAGLENGEILLGATSRAAHFLQASPAFGTIEAGKVADLVLVQGDPLQDLGAMSNISRVMVRGRLLDRGLGFAAPR